MILKFKIVVLREEGTQIATRMKCSQSAISRVGSMKQV